MSELSDKHFKEVIVKMLQSVMEMLEIKYTVIRRKNSLSGLNSGLGMRENKSQQNLKTDQQMAQSEEEGEEKTDTEESFLQLQTGDFTRDQKQ